MGVSVMVNYGLVTPLNDYLSLCGPEIQEEILRRIGNVSP